MPPPGGGFVTVRNTVPELAKSEGGIVVTSVVADTYVLETRTEFAVTVDVARKFAPVI